MRTLTTALMIAASLAASACGRKNSDKLTDAEVAAAENGTRAAAPDRRCASARTSDAVKARLFARAAEIRGGFADNYARIAGFALLQLDGAAPVAAVGAGESVDCRAHAVLRLPPGLRASGGRTQLGGDIDYSVAANGLVTLGTADALTESLATLSQSRSNAPAPPQSEAPTAPLPRPAPPPPPAAPPRADPLAPRPASPPPAVTAARPSYDCNRARTASERAVCANPGLAGLDRAMAGRYVGALNVADPSAARLLRQTRDGFLGHRERCGIDTSCIDRVYRGRMREIDDIVAGRWQGGR